MKHTREIEKAVIDKITERGDEGLRKYDKTMDRKDLSFQEWATHAQEELLDGAQYLERVIQGNDLLMVAYIIFKLQMKGLTTDVDTQEWVEEYEKQFDIDNKPTTRKQALKEGYRSLGFSNSWVQPPEEVKSATADKIPMRTIGIRYKVTVTFCDDLKFYYVTDLLEI